MTTENNSMPTIANLVWPESKSTNALRFVVLAFAGSLLIAVSSKVQIPFYPVPMTMQTFVILGLSMALGWRLAGATLALYLLQGMLGLPVFAGSPEKGIGLAYMMGGTGGYLLGFLAAAVTCGWLGEKGWDRNVFKTAAAMFIGNALIYIPGILWLGLLFGWDKPIIEWGLTPFILGDITKIALATAVLPLAWTFLNKKHDA
jgi:biotin transport system substrate-specific component|tara:strand:+ start:29 stop:634 length:606 start_codon:yes stop_codon:yes gene_type:complete